MAALKFRLNEPSEGRTEDLRMSRAAELSDAPDQ